VFLSFGATSPLNRRAERPIGFLPRRFPVQYIIHSIEGFLRGQPGRSRNETTRRASRRSRSLRSNHRDAQPAVKSFDVALFWISPRRGRTNQPRATPGEWEFPRNTSPQRAEQGVGDVAPLQGSVGCVAMDPGRCPGLICGCPFGANPQGLCFKSAGFSTTLRNSGTFRCGRPIVFRYEKGDFGPASRQWRNVKSEKSGLTRIQTWPVVKSVRFGAPLQRPLEEFRRRADCRVPRPPGRPA
jgi:hypothetical protein